MTAWPGSNRLVKPSVSSLAFSFLCAALLLAFLLIDSRSASATARPCLPSPM
jgi:hypothetical protein